MAGFIDYDLEVDQQRVVAAALAEWVARGYAADESDPATALIETIVARNAQTRLLLTDVARAVFRDYGIKVAQVTPIDAAAATLTATWTASDTAGHTIPVGTRAAYPVTGDQRVAFATLAEATIPPGSSTVSVEMGAVAVGPAANGLASGATMLLVDSLAWVASVVTTTASSGGVAAETAGEYLDRLAGELTLLSRVPRLEAEFALVAKRVAGVGRARAIRGYDAVNELANQPGHVTVAVADSDGAALGSGVKADVEAELEDDDRRALNVVVHVVDPTPVAVTVDFAGIALPGADPVVVEDLAIAAIEAYLDPGGWQSGGEGGWGSDTVVRYQELSYLLHATPGFDRWTTLTINGGTADVDLAAGGAVAPLPNPTVTGAVTSP